VKLPNFQLTHQVRNIITLTVILLFVLLLGGYYVFMSYPKKIEVLDKKIQELQTQITALEFVAVQLEEAQKKIEEEEIKLSLIDKQIVTDVTPAQTYTYLNNVLRYSGFFKFDMIYNGVEKKKNYSQHIYNVRGEGDFSSIYKFVGYLEKGPEIYKLRKLTMRGVETTDLETQRQDLVVTYEFEILALFAQGQDLPPIKNTLDNVDFKLVKNPFYPYVKKDLPPNFYDLLEVERAELKAIMPDKAIVVDHNRNTHYIQEGDEVYLGYVKKIDEANNRVIFTLDKGGIVEDFVLELRFGSEEEQKVKGKTAG
jgi:Tfp pilus assembly protein PilO